MKKVHIIIASIILMFSLKSNAQIIKAEIRATGLTCSMCSNAINKQLKSMLEVANVETDLNTFKNNINKYTDEYTKEYLLGQNLNKYSQNLTQKDLEKAKLSWHKTDTEYIKKVIKVIKSL